MIIFVGIDVVMYIAVERGKYVVTRYVVIMSNVHTCRLHVGIESWPSAQKNRCFYYLSFCSWMYSMLFGNLELTWMI